MRTELICFGSELLKDKVNTNGKLIAERLAFSGFAISRISIIGDELKEMEISIKDAVERSDILITCGGLGPTFDDLTRESVAKLLKLPLRFSPKIFEKIKERFRRANLPMPRENERQAYLVGNAKAIINPIGTAPGQIIQWKGKVIFLLPGPAKELLSMLDETVCPYLAKKYGKKICLTKSFHIFGYPESVIDERVKPVTQKNWGSERVKVIFGILASESIVDLKVTLEGKSKPPLTQTLLKITKEFYAILGNDIYGENEETLESVVGKILKSRSATLSLAESCTGGLIAHKVTEVAGSSAYFKEGIVAYSNESKMRLLGVKKETLKKFGAVSQESAEEMAIGILKRSGADWSIAVTGIAGPTGGTRKKPVGLVWFALANKRELSSCKRIFYGDRQEIKEKSALFALDLLRRKLCEG